MFEQKTVPLTKVVPFAKTVPQWSRFPDTTLQSGTKTVPFFGSGTKMAPP